MGTEIINQKINNYNPETCKEYLIIFLIHWHKVILCLKSKLGAELKSHRVVRQVCIDIIADSSSYKDIAHPSVTSADLVSHFVASNGSWKGNAGLVSHIALRQGKVHWGRPDNGGQGL